MTRDELARAVRTDVVTVDELVEWGFVQPDVNGMFRPSDIQRVRAVMAMRSPGIELDQLTEAFKQRLFTLQPMDQLYPIPEVVSDLVPAEVASSLDMEEQELIRVMIAAGFPAPRSGTAMREDDIRLVRTLVEAGRALGGQGTINRFARTYGDAARRAAESGVAMFAENVNSPVVNAHMSDEDRQRINDLAGRLMRASEALLGELYRRHLELTLLRQWSVAAETFLDQIGVRPASPQPHGLAFVDLTGYTALTQASGDATAVQLAARLAELAEVAVARHGGRVVKLLGDGAMLHFENGPDAVRGAIDLVHLLPEAGLPGAHAGVHEGPVIERDGDYFGATVNLAARVAAQATTGQVLTTPEVARHAHSGELSDLWFESIGEYEMKGVGAVELYRALGVSLG
jgi:class 3 adenylate cyclase